MFVVLMLFLMLLRLHSRCLKFVLSKVNGVGFFFIIKNKRSLSQPVDTNTDIYEFVYIDHF